MPVYPYRCSCGEEFDVYKSIHEAQRPEDCDRCGMRADRVFVPFLFSGAAVQESEWNPAFGQVVKNKYHRSELAKKHGVVEVGNDYASPESMQKHFDKQREDKRKQSWENV